MAKVLVTGASGFIGRLLVARLRESGVEVCISAGSDGSLSDPGYWRTLPRVDHVFHLAARSFVPDSWADPAAFVESNVALTARVLEYCKATAASMTYASAYVYGIPKSLPIRESDDFAPNNPYALTKHMGEQLCEFYARHCNVPSVAARIFNVYGPGQRRDFLIPTLVQQVLGGAKEIRVKDLHPRRDYVCVDDVVCALLASMRPVYGFHSVNIGTGVSYSVAELIAVVQEAAGVSLTVHSEEQSRINEIPDVRADIGYAHELLGCAPSITLKEGVARLVELERKQ